MDKLNISIDVYDGITKERLGTFEEIIKPSQADLVPTAIDFSNDKELEIKNPVYLQCVIT